MIEKIKSKRIGKNHEIRVEKSVYNFSIANESYIYVMVINHNVCDENKEYFNSVNEAIKFYNKFKTVKHCKNFIKNNEFPI